MERLTTIPKENLEKKINGKLFPREISKTVIKDIIFLHYFSTF